MYACVLCVGALLLLLLFSRTCALIPAYEMPIAFMHEKNSSAQSQLVTSLSFAHFVCSPKYQSRADIGIKANALFRSIMPPGGGRGVRERDSGRECVQCSSSVCVCVCVCVREVVVPFETSIGCTAIILRCSNRSRTALTCGRQSIHIGQQKIKTARKRGTRHMLALFLPC